MKEDKRRRILEAAVTVFAREGYAGAKVADIAKKAGVADGTIYLYFRSKEELLLTLFEEIVGEFIEEAQRLLRPGADAREKLATLATVHLQKLAANRDLAVVLQVELRQGIHHLTHITRSRLKVYLGLIKSILEEGQRAGLVRADLDPIIGAHVVFGSLDALITSWVLSGQPKDLGKLGDTLAAILMDGIAGPGAPRPDRKKGKSR
ncbi:MAG: TetR/AcrR family transcriptional regulator [Acidobacteriota bacterium]